MQNDKIIARRILIVLGGQNNEVGTLSQSVKERLDTCLAVYEEGDSILCTGGWGAHFNRLEQPHAFFAREYLLSQGLDIKVFLPFALSSNTVDDAVKVKAILQSAVFDSLLIVTSDFHMERAQRIFTEILSEMPITFRAAANCLDAKALAEVRKHEEEALKKIQEKGLYY